MIQLFSYRPRYVLRNIDSCNIRKILQIVDIEKLKIWELWKTEFLVMFSKTVFSVIY